MEEHGAQVGPRQQCLHMAAVVSLLLASRCHQDIKALGPPVPYQHSKGRNAGMRSVNCQCGLHIVSLLQAAQVMHAPAVSGDSNATYLNTLRANLG